MTRKNRVVITGLGAVTSLGHDFQRFSESIKSGSNPRSTPSFLSSAQDDIFIYTLPKDLDLRQFIKKKKGGKNHVANNSVGCRCQSNRV
jgi:3-oxoacyl-(acyl-carrier-protein) synthase